MDSLSVCPSVKHQVEDKISQSLRHSAPFFLGHSKHSKSIFNPGTKQRQKLFTVAVGSDFKAAIGLAEGNNPGVIRPLVEWWWQVWSKAHEVTERTEGTLYLTLTFKRLIQIQGAEGKKGKTGYKR